ncbi:nucleobase:cation symporter-2 family protein [Spelaeicoccus albus]
MGIGASFAYGFQHVLTMYGGIIAVPLIIGQAAGLSGADTGILIAAALFMCGLATLLQSLGVPFLGAKLPLVQGVTFASVATMLAIVTKGGGLPSVFGAILVSAAFGFVIAPYFSKVVRFFPPVVTGSVIATIGLSLLPTAGNWAMGGDADATGYGSMGNIGLAGLTLAIVLALSKVKSAAISRLSILLAMVLGTLIAVAFGMTDFSDVGEGAIFAFPTPFHFGAPTFHVSAIISMVIVVIVTLTETTADLLAIGEIVGTKVDSRRIANGLRADMLSSTISPIFGSFTQTAFAQNVGLVAVTKIKSRFVVAAGGLIMIAIGLFPVLGRVVADVPMPVLGGAGLVLFGTVAASGIRTLSTVKYDNTMNLIIVASSIGFGMIPIANPDFYDKFPDWFATIFDSGISSAAIMAIVLNLLFNHLRAGNTDDQSVFVAAGSARTVCPADVANLVDGDHVKDGKLIDADGEEVPVVDDV